MLLLPSSKTAILAAATSVMLMMDNQKNGHCGNTIHQEAYSTDICPIHKVAACLSTIMAQDMPLNTPALSFVQMVNYEQPSHVLCAVRRGAK